MSAVLKPSILSISILSLLSASPLSFAEAEQLAPVIIQDEININPNMSEADDYYQSPITSADGGEFLDQVNGVSISRFGGRGLEPVIRGQSQTRLNVLLDGAYIHGGCPNRMDPPASWAALETYESVTVLKGVQTLTLGSGGSGGTVLFERDTASLLEGEGLQGKVSLTATNQQVNHDLNVDVIGSFDDQVYVRFLAQHKDADNYEDGDGREVRSAFDHEQLGFVLGTVLENDGLLELTHERNDFTDALYPGAGMDSPDETGNLTRLKLNLKPTVDWLDEWNNEIYVSDVEHLMDNYSLRPLTAPVRMATPTTSMTSGLRTQLTSSIDDIEITYGLDWQDNERDAVLNNMNGAAPVSVSLMWPDIGISQLGAFAEATFPLADQQSLKAGLRVDWVDVDYGKANTANATNGRTANQSYAAYYGTQASDKDETNIGALLRYEKQLDQGWAMFAGLSRTVRTADATERGMNKWVGTAAQRWVGNPDIKAEKHHQLDVGVARQLASNNFSATVFYDHVNDYILRDSAAGQSGILLADNADIYRNVDAQLYGIELEASHKIQQNWTLSGSMAYVHADNTTDNRAIAQTPPLNGKVQLDYQTSNWGAGARLNWAAGQSRVDLLSKQEIGESAGYGVVDIYGHYEVNDDFTLRAGVDNLFDKTYAQHINRSNIMDNNAIRVNEPGQTAWLKATYNF